MKLRNNELIRDVFMKENIAVEKSYCFALKVVKTHLYLVKVQNEFVLSKQFLRSGTSVGANLEEAAGAQTRADFVHKIHIALKEAREVNYWIRLLRDADLLTKQMPADLINDSLEIIRILTKTLITCKLNDNNITNNKSQIKNNK